MLGILVIAMPIPIIVGSFTRHYQRLKPATKYWEDFQEEKVLEKTNHSIIGLYDDSVNEFNDKDDGVSSASTRVQNNSNNNIIDSYPGCDNTTHIAIETGGENNLRNTTL